MTAPTKVFSIRLDADLVRDFALWCMEAGTTPKAVLGKAMREAVGGDVYSRPATNEVAELDESPKRRNWVYLTPSEEGAIDRQTDEGERRAQWIHRAVRGTLTGSAQFSKDERAVVAESTAEIAEIAWNLAEIHRQMTPEQLVEHVGATMIVSLRTVLDDHVVRVERLISANRDRWKLE